MCALNRTVPDMTFFFFFNDTATTEIYTLSLHDALPICCPTTRPSWRGRSPPAGSATSAGSAAASSSTPSSGPSPTPRRRSEEHTSELQSRQYLVCRLLLEKKKKKNTLNKNSNKDEMYTL